MADEKDFRLVEYEQLRGIITYNIAQRRKIEEVCILAVAAFYAWTFSHVSTLNVTLYHLSLLFPGFIIFLGVLRWFGVLATISMAAGRMYDIETQIGHNGFGWEHYVKGKRADRSLIGAGEIITEAFVWAFLGFLCFFACIYLWGKHDEFIALVKAAT